MSKKSRLLALLLTLLMVVGMLPLAIFADEGTTEGAGSTAEGTGLTSDWETLKKTLYDNGFDAYVYQDFEKFDDSIFTKGVYDIPAGHWSGWKTESGVELERANVANNCLSAFVNYNYQGKWPFEIKNNRTAYDLVRANGNTALLLGNADAHTDSGAGDNYFDVCGGYLSAGNDMLFSIDIKLNGDHIYPGTLFNFITRQFQGQYINADSASALGKLDFELVKINGDGGIYCENNGVYTDIFGYVSGDEYTRVTVMTDIYANKYYIYLDNVLVTPDGCQLISDSRLNAIRGYYNKDKTAKAQEGFASKDFIFDDIRIYTMYHGSQLSATPTADNVVYHNGILFDNILLAGKMCLTDRESPNAILFKSDFTGKTNGEKLSATASAAGVVAGSGLTTLRGNGWHSEYSYNYLEYYEESDGSVSIRYKDADYDEQMKCTGSDGKATTYQTYLMLNRLAQDQAAYCGANYSISAYFRAGEDKIDAEGGLFAMIARINGKRNDVCHMGYTADRELYFQWTNGGQAYLYGSDGNKIKVPTDRFMKIGYDFICNSALGSIVAKVYIDDALVGTYTIPASTAANIIKDSNGNAGVKSGQTLTTTTPWIQDLHINSKYASDHEDLVTDDIHFKDILVTATNKYNDSDKKNPFAVTPEDGFKTVAGVKRYFESGDFVTSRIVAVDGKQYVVNASGKVVDGTLSDGIVQTPYAAYSNWAHDTTAATYKISSANAYSLIKGSISSADRAATAIKMNGELLYSHYGKNDYNKQGGSYGDFNNYNSGGKNVSENPVNFVMELDIKAGTAINSGSVDIFQLRTESSPTDIVALSVTSGWLAGQGGVKLQKLSATEYTRCSLVVRTVDDEAVTGGKTLVYDIYLNGVKVKSDIQITTGSGVKATKFVHVRALYTSNPIDIYFKNFYAYEGTAPQQYVKNSDGRAATPKDFKTGFVEEDGVTRYYNPETGLPIVNSTFEVDGKSFKTNANGVVDSTDCKHVTSDSGKCPVCGQKSDGVSSLYGNSLVLGSDVQVVFYLDLATEGVKEVQVGFAREFTAGKQTKIAFSELKTVDVDGKTYYKVPYAIAAKDVYTKVQLKVIKTGDTEGTTYSYSVEDYVNAVNAKPTDKTYTEKLKALCNALLVYGSNARAELTKDDSYKKTPGTVTWATGYEYNASSSSDYITLSKISLDLKSKIKIRVYFTFDAEAIDDGGLAIADFTGTITPEGGVAETVTLVNVSGDSYYIEYEVAAKDLGKNIEFKIDDGTDNGIYFTISAVECARLENAKATEGSAMQYLMQSIKAYAEAAKDYTDAENNRID